MHNLLNDRFDQKIDNQSLQQNKPLDYPFTSNEIRQSIGKLKKTHKKSPDLIKF